MSQPATTAPALPYDRDAAFRTQVTITPEALRGIEADLVSAYPDEGCGFLLGSAEPRHISAFLPVHNAHEGERARRFHILPSDYLRAERHAAAEGLDLVGVYHSHPEVAPVPSITDLQNALPWFSYLITRVTSTGAQETRSWQLTPEGRFAEESLDFSAPSRQGRDESPPPPG